MQVFTQPYLTPAEPDPAFGAVSADALSFAEMAWIDPYGDCTYAVDGQHVEICARNCRDLWSVNRSAPRLLMPVSGDFALETTLSAARDDRPAMGGLLLWRNEENYICLNWGERRHDEVGFEGSLDNTDLVFGRGKLPGEYIRLRLERRGDLVRALCSADGETWFSAGQMEFAADGDLQAGVYAIGHIDRAIYPGAYREGTAVRFTSLRLWH